MKYTRSESGEVIEVKGCASCPHMVGVLGQLPMICTHKLPSGRKSHKTLIGRWTGTYHASCPLPSEARNVLAKEVGK